VWIYIFISLRLCLGVEVLDHMITLCLIFWETARLLFQSICTILHSHQQCVRVPVSLLPCQHLLLSVVFFFFCSSPSGTCLNLESHIPVPYCDLFFLHLIMVILVRLAASYSLLIALHICKPIFCSSFTADPAEVQTGLDDWSWIQHYLPLKKIEILIASYRNGLFQF